MTPHTGGDVTSRYPHYSSHSNALALSSIDWAMQASSARGYCSRVSRLKSPWSIKTKFRTSDGHPDTRWGYKTHRDSFRSFVCSIWWNSSFTLFILNIVHNPNASADLDGSWLKRRCLGQGSTFRGINYEKFCKGAKLPETFWITPIQKCLCSDFAKKSSQAFIKRFKLCNSSKMSWLLHAIPSNFT